MSNPATFTLAEARDALKAKKFSSRELTGALVKAVEQSRGLNAYVTETPEKALAMAAASDVRLARARRRAGRPAACDQGSVLHQRCAHNRRQPDIGKFRAAL